MSEYLLFFSSQNLEVVYDYNNFPSPPSSKKPPFSLPANLQQYHEKESTLPPLIKLNTCFRFPLDGRAFIAYLQINTNRFRISNLVIQVGPKDFPSSNNPVKDVRGSKTQNTNMNLIVVLYLRMIIHKQKTSMAYY